MDSTKQGQSVASRAAAETTRLPDRTHIGRARFRVSDGNGLEIYADRARAQWPVVDGAIQMTTDPMDVRAVVAAGEERPELWDGLPRETVIGHVHFTVSHLESSVEFYRDVIGFHVT